MRISIFGSFNNLVYRLIDRFSEKFCRWGYDDEGDLALVVGPIMFAFYKWSNPTITWASRGFEPFNDANAKDVWRKVRKDGE